MSDDQLKMPQKKQTATGRNVVLLVVVLAILGMVAWRLLPSDKARELTDAARQQVDRVVDRVSPSDQPRQGENLPMRAVGPDGTTPGRVDGALNMGDLNTNGLNSPDADEANQGGTAAQDGGGRTLDADGNVVQPPQGGTTPAAPGALADAGTHPGAERDGQVGQGEQPDAIDKALADTSASSMDLTADQRAGLPTVSSALTRLAAPKDAGRQEDSVVTSDFFRHLARWLVASYHPAARADQAGRTSVTLMAANMRYGTGLNGLRFAGNDPVRGREAVLRYVYTPGMLDALYKLYVDRFLTAMADASLEARPGGRPALTDVQAADMFAVYAGMFRRVAAGLRGVAALPDLDARVRAVRDAGQNVVHANSVFAEVLFAYEQARDAGSTADAELLRQKMIQSTEATQRAVQARDAARRDLADSIKRAAGGRTPGEDSLIYLAEWVARRSGAQAAEATAMAADVLTRLAGRFDEEAEWLSHGGA